MKTRIFHDNWDKERYKCWICYRKDIKLCGEGIDIYLEKFRLIRERKR